MDAQATYTDLVDRGEQLIGRYYEVARDLARASAEYRRLLGARRDRLRTAYPKEPMAVIDAKADRNEQVNQALSVKLELENEWQVLRDELGFVRQQIDNTRTRAVTERTADQLEAQWGP